MVETIINNFEIWAKAQTNKGRGRSAANQSLLGINKLRELILELAVRGKLAPQNPDDEPASKLLKKITREKQRLISEGCIKKQEVLAEITEDEKPFILPEKWVWTRLGNLSSNIHYGYTASANEQIEDVRLLRITDIQNDSVNWESVPGCDIDKKNIADYNLEDGDILIARTGGTIGKSYLVSNINICSVFASYLIRVRRINEMYPLFIKTYLGSQLYWKQLYENSMGTGQPNVNGNALKNLMFPLPPLAEQHRIVAKVDELMALCDQLEQEQTESNAAHEILVETLLDTLTNAAGQAELESAWERIANHFDMLFTTEYSVDRLKQTILQLAVMGKLVPQNPGDEPASELLKRIGKEKAMLVKEGKIKKQEPILEIVEDKKPFDLPEKWVWCKLTEMLAIVTDGDHQPPPQMDSGIPFLVIGNLNSGTIVFENCKFVHEEYYLNLDWSRKPVEGDILYTVTGSYGISIPIDSNQNFCVQRHVAILKSTFSTPRKYLLLSLTSKYAYQYATEIATGIAQKTVPLTGLRKMLIPVPPINEQARIVAKVDELFGICDALKERIREAQGIQMDLAEAVVEGALI